MGCAVAPALLTSHQWDLAPLIADQIFATIAEIKRDGVYNLFGRAERQRAIEIADRGYVLETGNHRSCRALPSMLRSNPQVQAAYLGTSKSG